MTKKPAPVAGTPTPGKPGSMIARIFALMADGRARTLEQIARRAKASKESAYARLREMTQERYGAHEVTRGERNRAGDWLYTLAPSTGGRRKRV